MRDMKIGVIAESFRLPLAQGLQKAVALGADGVQIYATSLQALVDGKTQKAFRKHCDALELAISALVGDMGGHGLRRPEENSQRVARLKQTIDLAAGLGVAVVTDHIGVIPENKRNAVYASMLRAARVIGRYAAERKVCFAIETGPEPAQILRDFLDRADTNGLGVNLDPGNFVMVTGEDPAQSVRTLRDYIVHTHAKDGIRMQACDREAVYGAFATGGFEKLLESTGELFREVALGEGVVCWPEYLCALKQAGYGGFLTIEREVGTDPCTDIRKAIVFLKRNMRLLHAGRNSI